MNKTVEKWLLGVMAVASCVLLVGYALESDWVRTAVWTLAAAALGTVLVRRHWPRADDRDPSGGTS